MDENSHKKELEIRKKSNKNFMGGGQFSLTAIFQVAISRRAYLPGVFFLEPKNIYLW